MKTKLEEKERALRAKLIKKYHQVGEQMLEEQRERVRQIVQVSSVKLKSAVTVVSDPAQSVEHNIVRPVVVLPQSDHSAPRNLHADR